MKNTMKFAYQLNNVAISIHEVFIIEGLGDEISGKKNFINKIAQKIRFETIFY